MAEESDAGGQPADGEPDPPEDADGAPGDDGEDNGNGGDGVDPQVEPEVESVVSGDQSGDGSDAAEPDDGVGSDASEPGEESDASEPSDGSDATPPDDEHDGDAPDVDASDVADGPEDDEPGTGDARDDDNSEPIGAVTDASSPPSASAPDVDSEATADDEGASPVVGPVEADEAVDDGADVADVDADTVDPDPNGVETHGEAVDGGESAAGEPAGASVPDDGAATELDAHTGEPAPTGPPDDEEMPLADHVEEMVLRLAIVCGVAAVVAGAVFFFEPLAENTIMFIWNSVLPDPEAFEEVTTNPRVYGPLELKFAELKFASLAGFVLALPVFVYETYRFMRPGLYPNERRYYLASVPTSLVLAIVGISFAYFIILPAIFSYFVRYSERAGQLAFALRQTFDLIVVLMGYMALVFQIPLLIMLAIMMGLTSRQWLANKRLYFWGGFLTVSFFFVPEPTGLAPILVALTMIGLFEGTLALLRWTGS